MLAFTKEYEARTSSLIDSTSQPKVQPRPNNFGKTNPKHPSSTSRTVLPQLGHMASCLTTPNTREQQTTSAEAMASSTTDALPVYPAPLSMDSLPVDTIQRRKTLVKQTWRSVEFGLGEKAISAMYDRLFQNCPEVKQLYVGVSMHLLYTKFFAVLRLAVRSLDDFDAMMPTLLSLGRRHAKSYGTQRKHYRAMTQAFQEVLQEYICSQWTNMVCTQYVFDVTDAWAWCLNGIGDIMADGGEMDEEDLEEF